MKSMVSENPDSDPSFINWVTLGRLLSLSELSLSGILECWWACWRMRGQNAWKTVSGEFMKMCVHVCVYAFQSYIHSYIYNKRVCKTFHHNEQFQILMKTRGEVQETQGAEFQGKDKAVIALGVMCLTLPHSNMGFPRRKQVSIYRELRASKIVCVCVVITLS